MNSTSGKKLGVGDNKDKLYNIPFLIKHDLRWEMQQPITVGGWKRPSAFSCLFTVVQDVTKQ